MRRVHRLLAAQSGHLWTCFDEGAMCRCCSARQPESLSSVLDCPRTCVPPPPLRRARPRRLGHADSACQRRDIHQFVKYITLAPHPQHSLDWRTGAIDHRRNAMASSVPSGPRSSSEWRAAPWAAPASALAASDAEFISQFEDGSLPFESWTHAAHLRMATLQLLRHSALDGMPVSASAPDTAAARCSAALRCVVGGIQRYNGAHAAKLTVGFHWTITELWFRMVLLALAEAAAAACAAGAGAGPSDPDDDAKGGKSHGSDGVKSFLSLEHSSGAVAAVAAAALTTSAAAAGDSADAGSSTAGSTAPLSSSSSMWVFCSRDVLFGGGGAARGAWVAPDLRVAVPAPDARGMFPEACGVVVQAGAIVL